MLYNDKIISAVYCDSNGGRTYSSQEKWGGVHPDLIAKDDPWTKLSGAAKNGVNCADILNFYYPGTEIAYDYGDKDIEYERKVLEEIKVRVQTALSTLEKGLE